MEEKIRLKREAYRKRIRELERDLEIATSDDECAVIRKKLRNVERNLRKYEKRPERKDYIVKIRFVFEGEATVYAYSKDEAKQIVRDNFGMNCGEIKAGVPNILNWDINMKPTKSVK